MNRWYDKRPRLGKKLDELKEMDPIIRETISNDIIDLLKQNQPSLLTFAAASDFRFDSIRLRWYEHDPHLWLIFNALQLADAPILELVEDYFES